MLIPLHCIGVAHPGAQSSPPRTRSDALIQPLDRGDMIRRKLKVLRAFQVFATSVFLDLWSLPFKQIPPYAVLLLRKFHILIRADHALVRRQTHSNLLVAKILSCKKNAVKNSSITTRFIV